MVSQQYMDDYNMTISFRSYKLFVARDCFIPEPSDYYNLLRAGLELAEEYLEYKSAETSAQSTKELGDMYFWSAYLHSELFGFDCEPELGATKGLQDALICSILGTIKRYYRDKNADKLDALKPLVLQLISAILVEAGMPEADLRQSNYNKLRARLKANTIQGEGDNR